MPSLLTQRPTADRSNCCNFLLFCGQDDSAQPADQPRRDHNRRSLVAIPRQLPQTSHTVPPGARKRWLSAMTGISAAHLSHMMIRLHASASFQRVISASPLNGPESADVLYCQDANSAEGST